MDCEPTPSGEPWPCCWRYQPPTWVLVHPGRESTKNLQRAKLWAPPKTASKKLKQGEKDIDTKRETVTAWNRTQRPSPKHKNSNSKCSHQRNCWRGILYTSLMYMAKHKRHQFELQITWEHLHPHTSKGKTTQLLDRSCLQRPWRILCWDSL